MTLSGMAPAQFKMPLSAKRANGYRETVFANISKGSLYHLIFSAYAMAVMHFQRPAGATAMRHKPG